jgi:hypothetical protein
MRCCLAWLALVEPTAYDSRSWRRADDDQLLEIYMFVLGGITALAGFRAAVECSWWQWYSSWGQGQANERLYTVY